MDLSRRLDSSIHGIGDALKYGISVNTEAYDIDVLAKNEQYMIESDVTHMLHMKTLARVYRDHGTFYEFDYGLDEPLLSQATLDSQQAKDILEQQQTAEVQSVDSTTLHLIWQSDDRAVIVTNHSSSANSDLQYVVFVPFSGDIHNPALLESTARTFTAAILSQLATNKTVCFKFQVSESSLSSLLTLSNDFPVGALQRLKPGSQLERLLPLHCNDYPHSPEPHKLFAVVLDKPAFVQEPGVLFFILWTDCPHDKSPGYIQNPQTEEEHKHNWWTNLDRKFIDVRRSAGIPEAARRLAMLVVEEGVESGNRKLSPEEHRSLLSVSLEEYQSLADKYKEITNSDGDDNGNDGDSGND